MDEFSRRIGLVVSGIIACVSATGVAVVAMVGLQPPPALAAVLGTSLGIFSTLLQVPTKRRDIR